MQAKLATTPPMPLLKDDQAGVRGLTRILEETQGEVDKYAAAHEGDPDAQASHQRLTDRIKTLQGFLRPSVNAIKTEEYIGKAQTWVYDTKIEQIRNNSLYNSKALGLIQQEHDIQNLRDKTVQDLEMARASNAAQKFEASKSSSQPLSEKQHEDSTTIHHLSAKHLGKHDKVAAQPVDSSVPPAHKPHPLHLGHDIRKVLTAVPMTVGDAITASAKSAGHALHIGGTLGPIDPHRVHDGHKESLGERIRHTSSDALHAIKESAIHAATGKLGNIKVENDEDGRKPHADAPHAKPKAKVAGKTDPQGH
jgi:hypothetical protein